MQITNGLFQTQRTTYTTIRTPHSLRENGLTTLGLQMQSRVPTMHTSLLSATLTAQTRSVA